MQVPKEKKKKAFSRRNRVFTDVSFKESDKNHRIFTERRDQNNIEILRAENLRNFSVVNKYNMLIGPAKRRNIVSNVERHMIHLSRYNL